MKLTKSVSQVNELESKLITTLEAGARLGLSPQWVGKLKRDGLLRGEKIGRDVLVYDDSVNEYHLKYPKGRRFNSGRRPTKQNDDTGTWRKSSKSIPLKELKKVMKKAKKLSVPFPKVVKISPVLDTKFVDVKDIVSRKDKSIGARGNGHKSNVGVSVGEGNS